MASPSACLVFGSCLLMCTTAMVHRKPEDKEEYKTLRSDGFENTEVDNRHSDNEDQVSSKAVLVPVFSVMVLLVSIAVIACCIKVRVKKETTPVPAPPAVNVTTPVTVNNTTYLSSLKHTNSVCIAKTGEENRPIQAGTVNGQIADDVTDNPPMINNKLEGINHVEDLQINEGVRAEHDARVAVQEMNGINELKEPDIEEVSSIHLSTVNSNAEEERPLMAEAKSANVSSVHNHNLQPCTFYNRGVGFYG